MTVLYISVIRLRDDEILYTFQVAYRLYSFLWRNDANWQSICRPMSESDVYVPGHVSDEDRTKSTPTDGSANPDQPYRPSIVDLKRIPNWPEVPDQQLFPERFMVRQEYIDIDKSLEDMYLERKKRRVLIIGQPGIGSPLSLTIRISAQQYAIGKTAYLTFCLCRRLVSGKPTVLSTRAGTYYLFLDSGVYRSSDGQKLADLLVSLDKDTGMILNDCDECQGMSDAIAPGRIVSVTSPVGYVISGFKSVPSSQSDIFYMKPWDWTETALAR